MDMAFALEAQQAQQAQQDLEDLYPLLFLVIGTAIQLTTMLLMVAIVTAEGGIQIVTYTLHTSIIAWMVRYALIQLMELESVHRHRLPRHLLLLQHLVQE